MARKRRSYTDEFKQEAVRLVRERGLSIAQAGRDLGVCKTVIGAWVRKADAGELPVGEESDKALHAEIHRLRRELATVKEEREILKKPRPSSRRRAGERVPVHRFGEGQPLDSAVVSRCPGESVRLLRVGR